MEKGHLLYEGKAKKIYATDSDQKVLVEYKDDATAFDGKKKGTISDKGRMNAEITTILFKLLEEQGIPTHFLERIGERGMIVRHLNIFPIEVVMRNIVAGSLAERLGLEEGTEIDNPILEFYYKSDELGDPLINEYHIHVGGLADEEELEEIKELAFKINRILTDFFVERGIDLVDFKLEFGMGMDNKIYLGDEISPDTCRLWDSSSKKKLDKDRFRRDLGEVEDAYREILCRIQNN